MLGSGMVSVGRTVPEVRGFVFVIAALLFSLLGLAAPVAALVVSSAVCGASTGVSGVYAYDAGVLVASPSAALAFVRGSPVGITEASRNVAVPDRELRVNAGHRGGYALPRAGVVVGASADPGVAGAGSAGGCTHYDAVIQPYDYGRLVASPVSDPTPTRGPPTGSPVARAEAPSWSSIGGDAAKTASEVPTVVFSRSRAPGIAGTFDDAVANGAPTQLNRVGSAARDANRRAALRGQSPAPAGQSLDEYPFACSAQGGCGATVRSVPVGEQSYQGGVLSRFFQDNGVGVGDPFNVMFGP